jgi:hypothetical protein
MPRSPGLGRAVAEALKTAPTLPRDAAAVALARRYAALIDEAAPRAAYRKVLATLARVVAASDDEDAPEALEKVREALAEHSVASDLGPKLLAVLTSLGMTIAGRSARLARGGDPSVPALGASRLDELKARRASRADRAAAVDPAAP